MSFVIGHSVGSQDCKEGSYCHLRFLEYKCISIEFQSGLGSVKPTVKEKVTLSTSTFLPAPTSSVQNILSIIIHMSFLQNMQMPKEPQRIFVFHGSSLLAIIGQLANISKT